MGPADFELAGKLSLAALLGGLVGLEREMHSQPAGLRTHMIVAMGSCLIMMTSIYMGVLNPAHSDPARISAQVVAGIGFLGAGAIMRSGLSVRGLTTAACLWTVAAVGLAVGCGFWRAATLTTVLTLGITAVLQRFERRFTKGHSLRRVVIHARDSAQLVGRVEEMMQRHVVQIQELDLQRDLLEKKLQVSVLASCPGHVGVDQLSRDLSSLPDVEKVEIE